MVQWWWWLVGVLSLERETERKKGKRENSSLYYFIV